MSANGEDLLEFVLSNPEDGASEVQPALGASELSLLELRRDLGRLRDVLSDDRILEQGPEASAGRQRLAARVLDRTTREDPSWRGDLVLFSRFCRERLRSSLVLRIAAASLAIHLAAAPVVLAYLVLRKPALEPGFRTGIEPPVEAPYVEDPIEEPPVIRFLGPEEELPVPDVDLELLQGLDD